MSTYPITHTVAFAGYRLSSDKTKLYEYIVLDENMNVTDRSFCFKKRAGSISGIGVALELIQTSEIQFNIGNVKYLEYLGNRRGPWTNIIDGWRAEQEAASNVQVMARKMEGEDEWMHSLAGIKRIYQSSNRQYRAALIGKLLMYLDAP